jgi:hypothetical protein
MSTYKLFGQVMKECSKNGHWVLRIMEDDDYETQSKLACISNAMYKELVDESVTAGGLMKPIFDQAESVESKKDDKVVEPVRGTPISSFVVKVSKRARIGLPRVDSFVCVTVKPTPYKFEKDKVYYRGWNIILKKVSIESYNGFKPISH